LVRRSYRIHLTSYMARASPWTSTKVRVLWVNVACGSLGLFTASYVGPVVTPPRRPARPRPRRAAAPAPVVSSLLAALIRTPLSCRPADLTLTRAIERVGHARRHRHRARSTASGPAWARWGVAYYSRLRGGGGERCGVPHGRRTTVFHRVDTLVARCRATI